MLPVNDASRSSDSAERIRVSVVAALAAFAVLAFVVPSGAAQHVLRPVGSPAARPAPAAGMESVLFKFSGPDGGFPYATLTAYKGAFYGTASVGGLTSAGVHGRSGKFVGYGVAYAVAQSGKGYTQTYLYAFKNAPADGANPNAGVIADSTGNVYGTTEGGGTYSEGAIFKLALAPSGYVEGIIYSFKGPKKKDGANPYAPLLLASDGSFYGTTANGGNAACAGGCGTVFKLTAAGSTYAETVIYEFQKNDGHNPYAGLIEDSTGAFYGTTVFGGTANLGTVYKLTPSGAKYKESLLYSFAGGTDGAQPLAGLTAGGGGVLYGTTYNGDDTVCSGGCGTVYSLTPSGSTYVENVIYGFQSGNDGYFPRGGLNDVNGTLYGTTYFGGGTACNGTGCGVAYKLTPSKGAFAESIIYAFKGGNDGAQPSAGLALSGKSLFGVTYAGGGANCFTDEGPCGTIFSVKL